MSTFDDKMATVWAGQSPPRAAIEPATLVIHQCMVLLAAMRKLARWASSGVAAILGAGDLFDDDEDRVPFPVRSERSVTEDSPLLSLFFQLRAMLVDLEDLSNIDSLTVLQPFLLAIKLLLTLGHITSLALVAIAKFLQYNVIGKHLINIQTSVIQIMALLTHCRFEAGDQATDDAVLLHVLRLVEMVMSLELLLLLPDETVLEVVQTFLRLACNKKRSEVLRRAAEMSMSDILKRIFRQLELVGRIEGESNLRMSFPGNLDGAQDIGARLTTDLNESTTLLVGELTENGNSDDINTGKSKSDLADHQHHFNSPPEVVTFGILCINEFLGILVLMISPENQFQHTESTRVFALNLINTAVESSGHEIAKHPLLTRLIEDAGFKHVLHIIITLDSPVLLTEALQLFTTLVVVLGDSLKAQLELLISLILNELVSKSRTPQSKESLIEAVSLLWTRTPSFFSSLFINFDCDFDSSDLAVKFLKELCQLLLPEAARHTTDAVPPVCLEAILQFILSVNDRCTKKYDGPVEALAKKDQKTSFIEAASAFDKKPKDGLKLLIERGFIESDNDVAIAKFLYNKGGRLNKKVVGEYLSKQNNKGLLAEFMNQFEFDGLRVDEALRLLLRSFRLPGESQMIERIVETFAARWVETQTVSEQTPNRSPVKTHKREGSKSTVDVDVEEKVIPTPSDVFLLAYSIIMLNTDLHNPQVKKQMEFTAYQRQLRGQCNGKDYPEWYLARIYQSIKDREIIMPEEHHGTDSWFDDSWTNTIASKKGNLDKPNPKELPLVDKALFSLLAEDIISTLIEVFRLASDDHIITRLMLLVDKCALICVEFGLFDAVDSLLLSLADQTSLILESQLSEETTTEKSNQSISLGASTQNPNREVIPVTQIQVDGRDDITVSETAVWFGRDFKAQILTVVLFRLTKKTGFRVTKAWKKIVKIILVLIENCLLDANSFIPQAKLHKKFGLGDLPKIKPRYAILRSKPLRDAGLLLTFSSFLKGYADAAPEPTDQEVELTLSTMDCIKLLNVKAIFDGGVKGEGKVLLAQYFLEFLPEWHLETKRFYEGELLFIAELVSAWPDEDQGLKDLNVIERKILSLSTEHLTKKGLMRVLSIKLTILSQVGTSEDKEAVISIVNELAGLDVRKQPVLKSLSNLGLSSAFSEDVIVEENYWKVLRQLAHQPSQAFEIMQLVDQTIDKNASKINDTIYMSFLGLLDELSSLSAIASQPECEEPEKIIAMSKRSIQLTSDLATIAKKNNISTEQEVKFSLYQALAHQCFNPCRGIRGYAISVLQQALLSSGLDGQGIFNLVLFPLLLELEKEEVISTDAEGFPATQVETVMLVYKVFLHVHHDLKDSLEPFWLAILEHLVSFRNKQADVFDKIFHETGLESLKNTVLVLQSTEILQQAKQELWQETWKRIDILDKRIQQEVAARAEEEQKKGVEKKENENETETLVASQQEVPEAKAETEAEAES